MQWKKDYYDVEDLGSSLIFFFCELISNIWFYIISDIL